MSGLKGRLIRRMATHDPYQPTSLIALNSSVILGIAVEMMVLSRAMQKTKYVALASDVY